MVDPSTPVNTAAEDFRTEYISLRAASAKSGRHVNTLRRYIERGHLRAYRFGPQQIRVRRADLDALMQPIDGDA